MQSLSGVVRGAFVALVTVGLLTIGVVPAGAGSGGAAAPPSLLDQLILAVEDSLDDRATVAVLRAGDRGYDLLQVIEGLFEGALGADGTITEDGDAVEPVRASAGVISGNTATGIPPGGKARAGGATSGEDIALDALERGVQKSQKRLGARDDLTERAAEYDTSVDVFMALAVMLLMEEGYSIEQIVVDGVMAQGIDVLPLDGRVVIYDEKGKIILPAGVDPVESGDAEDADVVSSFMDDVFDALSGEDPLAAADDSFKRQYTLTIDVDITGDGMTSAITGKANIGARKGGEGEAGLLSGRGTGQYSSSGACSLSDLDTTEYPWTASAPVRIGVAGRVHGDAKLAMGVEAAAAVQVKADGDSICLSVVRDTADSAVQFVAIPDVTVALKDGATGSKRETIGELDVSVTVRVKKI